MIGILFLDSFIFYLDQHLDILIIGLGGGVLANYCKAWLKDVREIFLRRKKIFFLNILSRYSVWDSQSLMPLKSIQKSLKWPKIGLA